MLHRPIVSRQSQSAITVLNRGVSLLRLALLLGLLLQLRHLQGPSPPQESSVLRTIETRPALVGITQCPLCYDGFGSHTSLSQNGTIAAIGAPYHENRGYVKVFRFENSAWTQLGRTIFGEYRYFASISINALSDDGSVLAVGGQATSAVRVFGLVDNEWEPLGNNITHPDGANIGYTLAISGDGTILAAFTLHGDGDVGEVRIFELVGGMWSQKGSILQGQGEEQFFGWSLSFSKDGSRLAVGSPTRYHKFATKGFVRVYELIDNDWVQIGQTLEGTNVRDGFGSGVSLSSEGQTLAVGASNTGPSFECLGSVHVFHFGSDGRWFEPSSMLIGKSEGGNYGRAIALSGDASILVFSDSGLIRIFKANGNEWIEVGKAATDSRDFNYATISRDGSTAMGGASVFDILVSKGQLLTPQLPL